MERYRYRRAAFQTGFHHKISIAALPAHGVTEGCSSSWMVRVWTECLSGAELTESLVLLRSPSVFRCTALLRVAHVSFSTILESFKMLQEFWIYLPRTRVTVRKGQREGQCHSNKRLLRHDFYDTISHFYLLLRVRWGCKLAYVVSEFALWWDVNKLFFFRNQSTPAGFRGRFSWVVVLFAFNIPIIEVLRAWTVTAISAQGFSEKMEQNISNMPGRPQTRIACRFFSLVPSVKSIS